MKIMEKRRLEDKIAVITGAGRGIGREIALAFASLGTTVAANDINPLAVGETVEQIRKAGGNAREYVFDIAKRMPIEGMLAQVLEHFGRIDILVNHASIAPDASILDMDEWEFHRTLDVNLAGPFFCTQQVGRLMRQFGGGVMVNIVSSGRKSTLKGHVAHSASQAGLIGLTRAAAGELADFNIRVNAVSYGSNEMELIASHTLEAPELHKWQADYPNLPRGVRPDLVSLVLYLCSNAATSLTGQVMSLEPAN